MNEPNHDSPEPRWLKLAATLRAEPGATTLARVRARLAQHTAGPAWVRWLSRPVVLAASATLLMLSVFAGSAMLATSAAGSDEDTSVVSAMLGDDGSFGLPVEHGTNAGAASSDSEGVEL